MSSDVHDAIERHDVAALARLLRGGADPNEVLPAAPQVPPLHTAIEEVSDGGSIDAVVLLLRHGAAVDGPDDSQDLTPLLLALVVEQLAAARVLLAAGADPNRVGAEGDSALRWAVQHDDCELVALLLGCGADEGIDDAGGSGGASALGHAVRLLNVPIVRLLLDAGADPMARDVDRMTAVEHLPPRAGADPTAWDAVAELLGRRG